MGFSLCESRQRSISGLVIIQLIRTRLRIARSRGRVNLFNRILDLCQGISPIGTVVIGKGLAARSMSFKA